MHNPLSNKGRLVKPKNTLGSAPNIRSLGNVNPYAVVIVGRQEERKTYRPCLVEDENRDFGGSAILPKSTCDLINNTVKVNIDDIPTPPPQQDISSSLCYFHADNSRSTAALPTITCDTTPPQNKIPVQTPTVKEIVTDSKINPDNKVVIVGKQQLTQRLKPCIVLSDQDREENLFHKGIGAILPKVTVMPTTGCVKNV